MSLYWPPSPISNILYNSGNFSNNNSNAPQSYPAGQNYQWQRKQSLPNGLQGRETYQYQQRDSLTGQEQAEMYNAQLVYKNFVGEKSNTRYQANFGNGGYLYVETRYSTMRYNQNIGYEQNENSDFNANFCSLASAADRSNGMPRNALPSHSFPPIDQTYSSNRRPLSITGTENNTHNEPRMKRIYVRHDVGFGNALFVKGTGPGMIDSNREGWKIGIPMINDGTPDGWYFEVPENTPDFEYKVLVNNREWEGGENRKYQNVRRQIIVDADSGWGNRIALRIGNGPTLALNSWERNIEGRCADSNRWVFELPENAPSVFEYKAVKIIGNNNQTSWEQDRNHIWEDGRADRVNRVAKQQFSPRF